MLELLAPSFEGSVHVTSVMGKINGLKPRNQKTNQKKPLKISKRKGVENEVRNESTIVFINKVCFP